MYKSRYNFAKRTGTCVIYLFIVLINRSKNILETTVLYYQGQSHKNNFDENGDYFIQIII